MTTLINKTFDVFSSLKLTVLLFISISFYLAVSTFVPQESRNLIELYKAYPVIFLILRSLGLFTPYHNFFIVFVLFLFTFNLIACTLNRLPLVSKQILKNRDLTYFNINSLIKIDISKDNVSKEEAIERLKRGFKSRSSVHKIDGQEYLIFKKGTYSPLNFVFVHLSILIVVVGIVVSSISSYDGFIRLYIGRYEEYFNKEVTSSSYIKRPLPFKIRLNKFEDIRISSGMSVDYISDITIKDKDEGERNIKIRVNEPFEYNGIFFVQSGYEKDLDNAEFILEFEMDDKKEVLRSKLGEDLIVFGKEFTIVDFYEDVHNMGPAVKIVSQDDVIFALRDKPEIQNEKTGVNIYFKDFVIPYSSILRISYDKGSNIVFFGAIIFVLSMLLVLFYRFNVVFVGLSDEFNVYCSGRLEETIRDIVLNRRV